MHIHQLTLATEAFQQGHTETWHGHQVDIHCSNAAICLSSAQSCRVLSSAVYQGGWSVARHLLNLKVDRNYASLTPEEDIACYAVEQGFHPSEVVGLMTAVSLQDAALFEAVGSDFQLLVCATCGFANAAHPLDQLVASGQRMGTINLMGMVVGNLTESAQVGAVVTMTEAKSAALWDLHIRSQSGAHMATGTTSDAIAIAKVISQTEYTMPLDYAGLATEFGAALGLATYHAVTESSIKYLQRIGGQALSKKE